MFRPDNPLLPNYKWVPIGYHGRASSHRAQRHAGAATLAARAKAAGRGDAELRPEPVARLRDGAGHASWRPATRWASRCRSTRAEEHLFGFCLVNDWSARDIQTWEYQPLGPFLAKNFATTVSPWVVTLEALEPFRVAGSARPAGDPAPLPYLDSRTNAEAGAVDVTVEVYLSSARMRGDRPGSAAAEPAPRGGPLLDPGADAGPPHQQRLQPSAGRPASPAARSPARRRSLAAACSS